MAINPKDVGEIQKALNDAAGKASVLWTTFITFELYLAIAFGSVKHRDLFLENPIKLPVFNVELPLIGFFVVAPTVLVIFHFYVFLQLLALAKKAKDYDTLLRDEVTDDGNRQYLRQRLDSFLVLQILAGPKEQRQGFAGFSLRLIAWITLVGAPALVLLQGLVAFLPYHHEAVAWLQRVALLIDLGVIWYFWDRVRSDDEPILAQVPRVTWMIVGAAASVGAFLFSVSLATFPGERLDALLPAVRFIPSFGLVDVQGKPERRIVRWTSLHALLFAGEPDKSGRPRSLFSNRLVLADESFVDPDKLDKIEVSRSFRGRDLTHAVLTRADLRKAVFAGAMLNGANFDSAQLHYAWFGCVEIKYEEGCTWLQGASFAEAELPGAVFAKAHMEGANFDKAQLLGAWLNEAYLQGASFKGAKPYGATFDGSLLHGAVLDAADLQGVSFHQAELQGASLKDAKVWRARGEAKMDLTDVDRCNPNAMPWEGLGETRSTFAKWRDYIVKELPGDSRDDMKEHLSALDPSDKTTQEIAKYCETELSKAPQGEERQGKLAEFLVKMICSNESGSHIMRGLLRNGRINDAGAQIAAFAAALWKGRSDLAACPGVKGVSGEDWALLETLVAGAPKVAAATKPPQ